MLRHVVMFRWADGTTDEQIQGVRDGLLALPGIIPEISAYKLGDDAGLNEGNFDFVVVADFESVDHYLTYRDNAVHQQVIAERIKPIVGQRVAVQHEWHPALPPDLPA